MNVAVTLAHETLMTMRESRKWPNPANGNCSKVTWPLKFECAPKFATNQPTFVREILRKICGIRGEIYAELYTTPKFSDCYFDEPDDSWLGLTLNDTDHALAKIESCFGNRASELSVSISCLNKIIYFTDFTRQGCKIKCTSQKFPSELMHQLAFKSGNSDNFKITVVESWAF